MQGGAPGPGAAARPALKGEAGTHVSLDQKITSAPRWAMGRVRSLSRFVPRSVFLGSSRGWRAGAGAPAGHLALGHRLLLSAARCDRCWQGASRPGWGPGSGAWDGGQTSTPRPRPRPPACRPTAVLEVGSHPQGTGAWPARAVVAPVAQNRAGPEAARLSSQGLLAEGLTRQNRGDPGATGPKPDPGPGALRASSPLHF